MWGGCLLAYQLACLLPPSCMHGPMGTMSRLAGHKLRNSKIYKFFRVTKNCRGQRQRRQPLHETSVSYFMR